jgi:hypothetical protein
MKQGSLLKVLAGAALALTLASGSAMARDTAPAKDKQEALYPNATRTEPKLDLTSKDDQKALNDGITAANDGDADKATKLLQPVIDSSKSKYAQALALQALANLKYNAGDRKGAIELQKRALDNGILPNDAYFQLQYNLAQYYAGDEQYAQALQVLQQWRTEGKKETPESYGLEGTIDYRLEKYPESIAAIKKAQSMTDKPNEQWNQVLLASYSETGQSDEVAKLATDQLAKNPTDSTAVHNASAVMLQQQKYPEAIKLLEQGRSSGALKDETDWVNLAKAYVLLAQDGTDTKANGAKAIAVIDDGMAKGIVQKNADNYKLQGDAAIVGEDEARSVGYYEKAAPLAKDGEVSLSLAHALLAQQKYGDAKKAANDAISKGVKHKGNAYMALAESERGLKNKPAAIAAMKQAAQDPETASKANAWLKTAGSK